LHNIFFETALSKWALIFVVEARQRAEGRGQRAEEKRILVS